MWYSMKIGSMSARILCAVGAAAVVWLGGMPSGASAALVPYVNDAHTVALWHFDGTAMDDAGMLADSSSNGHTLVSNGLFPYTPSVNASFNAALNNLGGTSSPNGYTTTGSITLGSAHSFTIDSMLYLNSLDTLVGGDNRQFITYDGGISMRYRGDGYFQLLVGDGTLYSTAGQVDLQTWMHLTLTYDSTTGIYKMYKDGVDISGTYQAPTAAYGGTATNFRLNYSYTSGMDNLLDEVRISDIVRSQVVPEPASAALLVGLGLMTLAQRRRRD